MRMLATGSPTFVPAFGDPGFVYWNSGGGGFGSPPRANSAGPWPYRLCGASRLGWPGASRSIAFAPLATAAVLSTACTGAALIAATGSAAPPEYAKIPPIGHTMSGSCNRTERTGPIVSGAVELKMATKRVMPPSTSSSYTTSAWSRPVCGRESGL